MYNAHKQAGNIPNHMPLAQFRSHHNLQA